MLKDFKAIAAEYDAEILFDCGMSSFTSFKIGGNADVLIKANCEELIVEVARACALKNIPLYVVGKGSNLLICDEGLRGVVLVLSSAFSQVCVEGVLLSCSAGVLLSKLCQVACEHSLKGLEFAYGIPGTAGGALFMNAGAYGGEMKDVILSARFLDVNDGKIKELSAAEMDLSYRHSCFNSGNNIILSLCIRLEKGEQAEIKAKMDEIMKKRQDKQPLEYPSAGSTFKRPPGSYASLLIEQCGLKGREVGGAQVSRKHSGFIINKGNASFNDVVGLIKIVKDEVFSKTGVGLECEVKIVDNCQL
ncbi:MAG: UDP-N-acetylmuramate dehydrogenase [Oscillospiraceae bacterium]|nr:UDP-N-acetylmuramate dehydrogenase [Oscillospiraceae bacterium]